MKLFNITVLIVLLISMFGCGDDENILILKESGTIGVTLVGLDGTAVPDAKVQLLDEDGLSYDRLITDESGLVEFGAYNSGNYRLSVEAEDDDKYFRFTKIIQVVSGVDKTHEIDLNDYVINFTLTTHGMESEEEINASGYTMVLTNMGYNGTQEKTISQDFQGASVIIQDVPVGAYQMELVNSEGLALFSDYVNLYQYQDHDDIIYVNELELLLGAKSSYEVESVVNYYTSQSVDHSYKSVIFGDERSISVVLDDNTTYDATYYLYSNNYIEFSWSSSWIWGYGRLGFSSNKLVITVTDYLLNEEVVITLR